MNTIFTKTIAVLLLAVGVMSTASAQIYKKIGQNAFTLNSSSAALELESTTKGFLPPRMTTANRDAINTPTGPGTPTGLLIYNTDTNAIEVNKGTPGTPSWTSTTPAGNPFINIKIVNYPMNMGDYTTFMDASSGALTLTLPAGPGLTSGKIIVIGKVDETPNVVTFTPGLKLSKTSTIASVNYPTTFRVQYDGTNWNMID